MRGSTGRAMVRVATVAMVAVALAVTASAADRKVLLEYFNATW